MRQVLRPGAATSYIVYTTTVLSAVTAREYMFPAGSQPKRTRVKRMSRYVG
jgi:hypothetical protein